MAPLINPAPTGLIYSIVVDGQTVAVGAELVFLVTGRFYLDGVIVVDGSIKEI